MGRGDLKLDIPDKRMLAAVQAYCSYAWDSIVRPLVLTRWEQQKGTETFADAEDPLDEDEASPSDTDSGIPLTFKIKVATELYDLLPAEEKRNIDRRRAEDKKKLYRSIPQIPDDVERRAKLRIHKRYFFSMEASRTHLMFLDRSEISRSPLNHCSASSRTWKIKPGALPK